MKRRLFTIAILAIIGVIVSAYLLTIHWGWWQAICLAQFFLAAMGVAFSAYLTYVELFLLRAICPWCVLSATLITLIAILSALELNGAST